MLVNHPEGNYAFLPGIAPYSCGVASVTGYEIAHVTLHEPVPYEEGFLRIAKHLDQEKRPKQALCGIELRSPAPYTFAGFAEFNGRYGEHLARWGLFVDGVNPVARTNVAPEVHPPNEPLLYGFSYSRPCEPGLGKTFVVAGAGELPEGILAAESIIRRRDVSPEGLNAKAEFVMDLMESRLLGLGGNWPDVTAIDIYTIHPIDKLLPGKVLARVGVAAGHGVRWFYTRPPIVEIEYEMDLRGVCSELRI